MDGAAMDGAHPALVPGNVAVVTGAASGIGLAAACRFARFGMTVCLVDHDGPALAAARETVGAAPIATLSDARIAAPSDAPTATPSAARIAARSDARADTPSDVPSATPRGARVEAFTVDVGDRAAMTGLAATIAARVGPVTVLMNNAAIAGGTDALGDPEGWGRLLGVNFFGVLHGIHAFVPGMIAHGAPALVINTGSKQGITQPPGDTAYNVSKSAVKALTEGLAHTLRNRPGCRVTAHLLIPGFTYTGMTARRFPTQPPGAWTPDQVIDRLLSGMAAGDFYVLCQDGETTRAEDEKRILWHAQDLVENRPALSRWHPDWQDAFARFMQR